MTERNLMVEDMFEKARRAFFETAKTPLEQGDPSAEFLNPGDERRPKEVTDPSSDKALQ